MISEDLPRFSNAQFLRGESEGVNGRINNIVQITRNSTCDTGCAGTTAQERGRP
jgi:hypothetical protein